VVVLGACLGTAAAEAEEGSPCVVAVAVVGTRPGVETKAVVAALAAAAAAEMAMAALVGWELLPHFPSQRTQKGRSRHCQKKKKKKSRKRPSPVIGCRWFWGVVGRSAGGRFRSWASGAPRGSVVTGRKQFMQLRGPRIR